MRQHDSIESVVSRLVRAGILTADEKNGIVYKTKQVEEMGAY